MASSSTASDSPKTMVHLKKLVCPYHDWATLVEDHHAGDMICPECGLVVGDRIVDVGSEWRTFSNEKDSKDNCRVGASENPLLDGADLSTCISAGTGSASFDESGRPIYNSRRQVSSSDRALLSAFQEITQMSDRLNLPRMIVDRANTLFKKVHVTKSLKGQVTMPLRLPVCTSRVDKKMCQEHSKISKKEIGRVFKLILKTLETSVDLITSGDFMSRFCSSLGLPTLIQRAATYIANRAVELDIVPGRSPISVAAAAIYMASQASNDKKTHKEIGDISGVAEVTIKQSYRLMFPRAHDLFPDDFNFAIPIEQLPVQ